MAITRAQVNLSIQTVGGDPPGSRLAHLRELLKAAGGRDKEIAAIVNDLCSYKAWTDLPNG